MTDTRTLVLPRGAEEGIISHANQSFVPYREDHLDPASDLLVEVPGHAAVEFLHKGGFSLYEPAMRRRLSGLTARMIHKDGPRSCSWDGEAYEPDETGAVTVPVESQNDLFCHGFIGAPPVEEPAVWEGRPELAPFDKAIADAGAKTPEKASKKAASGT